MKKSKQKKIIKQIEMLCEKQYRKGFQQGFYACKEKTLTEGQVLSFRHEGAKENYSKVKDPFSDTVSSAYDRLLTEMAMPKMADLISFIHNREYDLSEQLFQLEFNEIQQAFHLNHANEPESHGYKIIANCTEIEHSFFMAYVDSRSDKPDALSLNYVIRMLSEAKLLLGELTNNGIDLIIA